MPICIWETSPPQAIHTKKAIKPIPTLTHGTTGFQVPLHSPPCSISLLSSTNKILLTSTAGVCLCFHSQSGLKNPEHLKSQCMSSVYHIWRCMKGQAFTWGWYRLCQTGKGCLGMWPWPYGIPMESILQECPPPQPSYGGPLRPNFSLSLSLPLSH
jgi:hypothetical protein